LVILYLYGVLSSYIHLWETAMESTIGYRIRLARKSCGYTQAGLAKQVGISTITFNRYETGNRGIDSSLVVNLAEILNCDLIWLLTGQGDMRGDSGAIHQKASNDVLLNKQNDPLLTEIMQILVNDLPDEKESFLKVLLGRKQMREGLSALGVGHG
jgi:transcriptional regulator with XRE-family HTH domain